MKSFLKYHAPALAYAALIIFVSSIERLSAPQIDWLSTDKLAHVVEYALFAFLFYRSISHLGPLKSGVASTFSTFLILILFAASDEFHQKFVEGRSGEALDVVADILGGGLVILLMSRYRMRRQLAAESAPEPEVCRTESK